MNILSSLTHATPFVQFIIFTLLIMSIVSWGIISLKTRLVYVEEKRLDEILKQLNELGDTNVLTNSLKDSQSENIISETIIQATKKISKCERLSEINNTERVVQDAAINGIYHYKTKIEKLNPALANIANIAPYIGLLGTVCGLLAAFQSIGDATVVTFQTIAPSIAEALFATAIGLFVAIPASSGYSFIATRTNCIINKLTIITDTLINQISSKKIDVILEKNTQG